MGNCWSSSMPIRRARGSRSRSASASGSCASCSTAPPIGGGLRVAVGAHRVRKATFRASRDMKVAFLAPVGPSTGRGRGVGEDRGVLPEISPATADALRTALDRAGYRTDGVRALLGREAHAALTRGEPEPAFRATADGGALGVLVRMLLLGAVEPDTAVAAALAPLTPVDAEAAGLLRRAGDGWAAALDLRPHGADDGGEWWVLSDLDARRQERDHVTGVGGAPRTLPSAAPPTPMGPRLPLPPRAGGPGAAPARAPPAPSPPRPAPPPRPLG